MAWLARRTGQPLAGGVGYHGSQSGEVTLHPTEHQPRPPRAS